MALTRIEPGAVLRQSKGGTRVVWPNGSQVRVVGCHTREDIERLRAAGNTCLIWAEELAAWRKMTEAWQIALPGLRKGPNPRVIATTTPKARPEYREIRKHADHLSHATILDNPNLNQRQKELLIEMFEGTSIGQQELFGELIEEAEGAIWNQAVIDAGRILDLLEMVDADGEPLTVLERIVVAIDPPGGATEAGIVVAGTIADCPCGNDAPLPHYAVLSDVSGKLSPEQWGSTAVDAYHGWDADRIVAEINYGGDMVKSVIKTVDRNVPYKPVRATRGKKIRAEPVFALYEQTRVHHVELFAAMESEMVQWIPDESEWSPNRLDALVWAVTELSGRRGWTSA